MNDETPIPERKRSKPETPAEISELNGTLSEDARRVKVRAKLSNGMTQPDLELILLDETGREIARTTILENFGQLLTFTMHIRQSDVKFPLSLTCQLSYLDNQIHSEKMIRIEKA
jgi:hypothetical protein